MNIIVSKRYGGTENFNPRKICSSIKRAAKTAGETISPSNLDTILNNVISKVNGKDKISSEELSNLVEMELMNSDYKKTAREYILYTQSKREIDELTKENLNIIDKYLKLKDWEVKENSNIEYSLQGLNFYITSKVHKTYWLNKIYNKEIRDLHNDGFIHIHDLGLLAPYCVGWDLYDFILSGFKGVKTKIESDPPKHLRSALGQLVNLFYTLQGEAAGAQAVSNFDTLLAPFIYYDGLSYSEVKQAVQEFIYNLNVPTRVGFQTPFTNITLDLVPPSYLADQAVIIGGKVMDKTYKEFTKEMDMINMALFEVLSEGDANGRVFTFPIPTINITKDFKWDSKIVDFIMEATAKYGIPYFANYVNSNMNPEDARSMCCRLRLDTRSIRKGGGLFGASPLTGSIGVVTINLPRIGYLTKGDKDKYFKMLEDIVYKSIDSLNRKRSILEKLTDRGLYPYIKFYLRNVKEKTGKYWSNHFSTIGIIGMNESIVNFFDGKEDIGTDIGYDFANEVMDFILNIIESETNNNGIMYNLEATPGESVSYRFALIDKTKYPDIYTQGVDEPYYTNSTWLPVNYTDDLFRILEHQDRLQSKYTGGTVQHIFIGEKVSNPVALKKLLKKLFDNFRLPYISFTPSFSICDNHGYISGEHEKCPTCGAKCEIYSRVVGYLRPVSRWNKGKEEEFKERKYLI